MFARFGMATPWTIGSCTPEQVASAVVEAILRDRPEIIVNSMPLRPQLAPDALSPRLGPWLLDTLGIMAFQWRKVGTQTAPPMGRASVTSTGLRRPMKVPPAAGLQVIQPAVQVRF
jgi:hypothetical protein